MLKSTSFPLTVPNRTSNFGEDFSLQSPEFYSCIQFEIRKSLGLLILLNCEATRMTVSTTMYHQKLQTSDNLLKISVSSLKYLINLHVALVVS